MIKRYIIDRKITFEELKENPMGPEWVKNDAFMMMEKDLKDTMFLDGNAVISDFKRGTTINPNDEEYVVYSLEAFAILRDKAVKKQTQDFSNWVYTQTICSECGTKIRSSSHPDMIDVSCGGCGALITITEDMIIEEDEHDKKIYNR